LEKLAAVVNGRAKGFAGRADDALVWAMAMVQIQMAAWAHGRP
jgi:hypothetical protein